MGLINYDNTYILSDNDKYDKIIRNHQWKCVMILSLVISDMDRKTDNI